MPTRGSLPRFRADIPPGANWVRGKFAGEGLTGEPAIPARYRKLPAARHPRPGVNVTTVADSGPAGMVAQARPGAAALART